VPESNSSTESRFVVARLGRPHGLDGYLGLYVDEADSVHFAPDNSVLIDGRPYQVGALRRTDRGYQVRFVGVENREAAEEIRGLDIEVATRRQLGPDEYWPEQLAGLQLRDSEGNQIGRVIELVFGSAQDRLAVEVDGSHYEIPFVDNFVPVVDLEGGYVEVNPIPGLIEPLI
jgi:16S rRNA processing protein RimM